VATLCPSGAGLARTAAPSSALTVTWQDGKASTNGGKTGAGATVGVSCMTRAITSVYVPLTGPSLIRRKVACAPLSNSSSSTAESLFCASFPPPGKVRGR